MQVEAQQAVPGLAGIDVVTIITYMVGVFILGTFYGKYVKSAGDFFLASRALPFWAIGMSIVVSDIGAMDFVAVAGSAYNDGVAVANFDWIGSMPAMVFAAFLFVPYFWRSGVYSVPEFLGRRYNTAVQVVHAAIWGIFLLTMLALMLWVTGNNILHTILGWNPYFVIWLMVFVCGVYTFSGGLSAVVMTDVVQLIVMFVGGLALLALSLWEVGGWESLKTKVLETKPRAIIALNKNATYTPEAVEDALARVGLSVRAVSQIPQKEDDNPNTFFIRLNELAQGETQQTAPELQAQANRSATRELFNKALADLCGPEGKGEVTQLISYEDHFTILLPHNTDKPYPWTGIVFGLGIVLAIAYMSGNQVIVQRTFGARSEWDAKGGMLFGGFLKSFIPLMVALPGLCAIIVVPDLAQGDTAVPEMIKRLLPPGLKGLMFVALFAALMSSVDSTLNSATTIWTTDLYGRVLSGVTGKRLTERHALIMGRVFTVIFIISAGLLAPMVGKAEGLYVFIQTALSMFQGPTLAILLLGVVWRRATRWGGFAGLVLGVAFTTILNCVENLFPSDDPFLFVAWWSFVFSLIVTVVVSLLTRPEPEEKIRGLVWGQIMKDGKVQRVLQERVS